jgi:imidazole glycerol-phosphate synthase subunit HisH
MITIIDYNAGNLRNVQKVFDLYDCETKISSFANDINNSTGLVLPGVGHFQDGMINIENFNLVNTIQDAVLKKKIPILGICLGMQLMSSVGHEGEKQFGLGLLQMECKPLEISNNSLRVPHIGWNSININHSSRLLKSVPNKSDFYFVHSYAVQTKDDSIVSSTSIYGKKFISSVESGNIFATQFHPEKSQKYGQIIIKNFINLVNNK